MNTFEYMLRHSINERVGVIVRIIHMSYIENKFANQDSIKLYKDDILRL